MNTPKKPIGLVLSGGGARGAYQVGVINAIAEICEDLKIENPFLFGAILLFIIFIFYL